MNGKRIGAGVVTVLAAVAGSMLARQGIAWLRAEPEVPAAVVSRPWSAQTLGGALSFDSPIPLSPTPVDLPPELRALISQTSSIGGEGDGLNVMAMYMAYVPGTTTSLEGAADGALANVKGMPDTRSMLSSKKPTSISGQPAFEISAEIARNSGESLKLHGLVTGRGVELFQLLLIHRADQPTGDETWKKMLASATLKPAG